jgi:hypothetical protein
MSCLEVGCAKQVHDTGTACLWHGTVGEYTKMRPKLGNVLLALSVLVTAVPSFVYAQVQSEAFYTVQQKSSGRFLDAHESSSRDYAVVTRPSQNNDTQRWCLNQLFGGRYMRQISSSRFLDAYEISSRNYAAVTRSLQGSRTQQWTLTCHHLHRPVAPGVGCRDQMGSINPPLASALTGPRLLPAVTAAWP